MILHHPLEEVLCKLKGSTLLHHEYEKVFSDQDFNENLLRSQ